jgi:hypothetical protein
VTDRRRTVLKTVGVALLVLVGAVLGVAAIIGLGYLSWLAIRGLVIVVARAIVDSISESLSSSGS